MKTYFTFIIVVFTTLSINGQNIPIDFEEAGNGADWTWTVFENDTNPPLEIIENPDASGINTSATVAKFTALQTGQPFAGCESLIGADIGPFTIDASNSTIRIMVWKSVISDVGIKLVRNDFFSLGEIKIANTLVNQWEEIEFDFSSHIGNTYHQIVIFPDFASRTMDNVIYFDNVYDGVVTSTENISTRAIAVELFPNPASNNLTIRSDEYVDNYAIYSLTGELIAYAKNIDNNIDITQLPKGMYLLKATSKGQTVVEKFVKE